MRENVNEICIFLKEVYSLLSTECNGVGLGLSLGIVLDVVQLDLVDVEAVGTGGTTSATTQARVLRPIGIPCYYDVLHTLIT